MKKTFLLGLSAALLTGSIVMMGQNTKGVNAADSSSTIQMGDMIIWTAMKEGKAFTDFDNVDLQVLHGNLETNTINEFSTYKKEDGWAGSLGADSDAAHCVNWKLYTSKNDGIIAKLTAKKPLKVTMAKENKNGVSEWIDGAKFGGYKGGTDGALNPVKASTVITGSETAADFAVSSDLAVGESYYFEFRFQWDDTRNMDPLPSFNVEAIETPDPVEPPAPVVPTPSDLSGEKTVTLPTIAKEEALLEGEPLTLDGYTLQALQGTFHTGFTKYGNYQLAEDNETGLLSASGTFDGRDTAAITSWRIKTTDTSFPAFVIEATRDIRLSITHEATLENSWIDEAGQFFGLYFQKGADTYSLWERSVTEKVNPANAFGGEVMLKAGDKAIWLFGSNQAYERNIAIQPQFSSDGTFDQTAYDAQSKITTESTNMWDALTKTINNSYNDAEYHLFDYGFYYGSVTKMKKFTSHEGDGTGTEADALWSGPAKQSAGFQRWQFQCSSTDDAIMKITAKENAKFDFTHTAIWADAWCAVNSALRFYALAEDGTLFLTDTKVIQTGTEANAYAYSISLRKGEALLIDYTTLDGNYYSLNYAPSLSVDTEAFSEENAVDFESARALAAAKSNAVTALEDKANELGEDNYTTRNWGDIQAIKEEAIKAIDACATIDEVNATKDKAIADMMAVPTAEQLQAHKTEVLNEFEAYFASLSKSDYSEEDWAKIESQYTYYKNALNAAQTTADMDRALAAFKQKVEAIEKVEPKASNNVGLIVGISVAAAVVVAGAATGIIIAVKKKKEK